MINWVFDVMVFSLRGWLEFVVIVLGLVLCCVLILVVKVVSFFLFFFVIVYENLLWCWCFVSLCVVKVFVKFVVLKSMMLYFCFVVMYLFFYVDLYNCLCYSMFLRYKGGWWLIFFCLCCECLFCYGFMVGMCLWFFCFFKLWCLVLLFIVLCFGLNCGVKSLVWCEVLLC